MTARLLNDQTSQRRDGLITAMTATRSRINQFSSIDIEPQITFHLLLIEDTLMQWWLAVTVTEAEPMGEMAERSLRFYGYNPQLLQSLMA